MFTELHARSTEGIAQILAAPSMLERLDELYDRDDDGQFVKFKEVERIRELAKLCPTRLRNHRGYTDRILYKSNEIPRSSDKQY